MSFLLQIPLHPQHLAPNPFPPLFHALPSHPLASPPQQLQDKIHNLETATASTLQTNVVQPAKDAINKVSGAVSSAAGAAGAAAGVTEGKRLILIGESLDGDRGDLTGEGWVALPLENEDVGSDEGSAEGRLGPA